MPEIPGMDELPPEERMKVGCLYGLGSVAVFVLAIAIACIVCLLTSCTTTKYVPVETVRTERVTQTDTIHHHDSIVNETTTIIREVDSLTMARYGIQLKDAQSAWLIQSSQLQREIDRLREVQGERVEVHDSVPVPYPVEVIKEVAQPMTWWQRLRQSVGGIAIALLLIVCGWKIYRIL